MKKLKHTYKRIPVSGVLASLLSLSLLTGSCRKLISIPPNPPSQIPQSRVFSDSADIQAAVTGIYANFKVPTSNVSFVNGAITVSTSLSADELRGTNAFDQLAPQFYQDIVHIDNSTVGTMWKQAYSDLYQMNVCLEGIGSTTVISDSLKSLLTGQIKVIRALYYFNLVNLFGGVPVVTSSDYATNAILPRVGVDSVYSLIQSDLADARSRLPASYASGDRYRPSVYAAEALSAKVYLYRKDWNNAANMASQVINSGVFNLEPNPDNVFLDGSNEAIWQLPGNGTSFQTAEGFAFNPSYNPTPTYVITSPLLSAFETGDLRMTDWVSSSSVNGTVYYYPYKYKNGKAPAATQEDYMILRLGEQYLILAEALARQNQLSGSLTNLNLVRTRAGLSGSTAVAQADVLTAIMHERQTELFCEWGNRWLDLKRTGAIDNVLGVEKPGSWNSYAALYPVPLTEIQTNPFLVQNPGY
jgi:starch-binding outer membrane protein, SusD/RagB family